MELIITQKEYEEIAHQLALKIRAGGKTYSGLYPIPRGGYLIGILLSQELGLPLITDKEKLDANVLVVDDILDSGRTIREFSGNDTAVAIAKKSGVSTYYGRMVGNDWIRLPDEPHDEAEKYIARLLQYIGEDASRDGLVETPKRIVKMWTEIFRGYCTQEKPKVTVFPNDTGEQYTVSDAGTFYSMCEHHALPFFGKYRFVYKPKADGKILGISKVSRMVSWCSARLQVQERLAVEIVNELWEALSEAGGPPLGMAIELEAMHLCKSMRGAKNAGNMKTLFHRGEFDADMREELRRIEG